MREVGALDQHLDVQTWFKMPQPPSVSASEAHLCL